ncbi:MAG TPA: NapC/NirT family cytochrome c [Bryobacteraceae bacterium]|nr:NapC/NirT family cytochrome c [Bryobacteraceae bacterium]
MSDNPKRPILWLLTSHWISLLGTALVTTAGFSWLFALPMQLRGHASNPYVGILVFLVIPGILVFGLVLIALGIYLSRRHIEQGLLQVPERQVYLRKLAIFFAVTTALNVIIGAQVTYRAVAHMETVQFCGQSCHLMQPEYITHVNSPHAGVECVDCHVTPGAVGWAKSKMGGMKQGLDIAFNRVHNPIESAIASGRLVPASDTCEQCHFKETFEAVKLRVIFHFQDDQKNTQTQTALTMLTGGGKFGGIHGKHFGPGIEIFYSATDPQRQTIPLVEYRNRNTGEVQTYLADGSTAQSVANLQRHQMQCVDCHNNADHGFELPERAVDRALGLGQISPTLPFIKKKAMELLKAKYSGNEEASRMIPAALADFYLKSDPAVAAQRSQDISIAGVQIAAIYNRNVFPDLKVTWGTYPDNLGHTDFPGCFRCHDGSHNTADKKMTITQDCNTCHVPVAVDEAAPKILTTLGIEDRINSLQKQGGGQ